MHQRISDTQGDTNMILANHSECCAKTTILNWEVKSYQRHKYQSMFEISGNLLSEECGEDDIVFISDAIMATFLLDKQFYDSHHVA